MHGLLTMYYLFNHRFNRGYPLNRIQSGFSMRKICLKTASLKQHDNRSSMFQSGNRLVGQPPPKNLTRFTIIDNLVEINRKDCRIHLQLMAVI
jgi:hypothetical protein